MCAEVVGAVLAALLAAGAEAPADSVGRLVLAFAPSHVPGELVYQAMPPPPQSVVLETNYYGKVTVDHRAHLAMRIRCSACHDPGPVTKIEFTAKIAHERCVACHRTQARGPTTCKGCHVKPPEPTILTAKADEKPAEDEPVAAKVPAGPPPGTMAALMLASPPPPAVAPPGFHRSLEMGYTAGTANGLTLRLAARQERIALALGVDRLSGDGYSRMFVLAGGGVAHPIAERMELVAVGLAGVDAVDEPDAGMMPALGARVGVSWLPPGDLWLFQSVNLSITGVVDVANRSALGRDIGGTSVYGTLAMGFGLQRR